MRKILLLSALLVITYFSQAQVSEIDRATAMQLVQKNSSAIGLMADDLNNSIVTHTYIIANSDVRMVYLQQSYQGIPVYNQLHVLAFRGQQLVSSAGSRVQSIDQSASNKSGTPAITPEAAVQSSLTHVNLSAAGAISATKVSDRKYEFGDLGVTSLDISAELLWMPVEGTKEVYLVWQVFVTPKKAADYWLIRVNASNGSVINKENLTVTCNWGDGKKHSVQEHFAENHESILDKLHENNYVLERPEDANWHYKPFVVNSATYRVVPYPAESPWHPGGSYALRTDPWLLSPAGSPATTLKWHDDGLGDYNYSRGNNVWAQEDQNNNNGTGTPSTSTTALPNLTFDFAPDTTLPPTQVTNQQFNITNLFYWNNLMHDISYQYGFTEAARNFQEDNLGRGGLGSDHVFGDAQDGGGLNNANFATPADGNNPRMQMYLWNFNGSNPLKDGDADNGVIAHEYTHGISNRLTGTGSGCLGNAEQMGEGWSDYYALMVTHNWATATPSDGFNNPRPIGLYALNGGGLFGPPGIRHFPYCTNMAVNPSVYAASIPASPHDRGEIWCATLWDMTWNLIAQDGISANIFNATSVGGNVVALKLVTEGLRLQPCSPGFISGRDAILRADTIFYGGVHACAIWTAFARRGMGVGASQGASTSVNDQIPSFANLIGFGLNPSAPVVQEGTNITFTTTISNPCGTPITNYSIRDTLPPSVTYVSSTGGTLAANVVTFTPVTVPPGGTQNYSVTVNVNAGTYFAPNTFLNDPANSLAPNWTSTAAPNDWVVSAAQSHSAPSSFFASDPAVVSDKILTSTGSFPLSVGTASFTTLSFWHFYNTELNWDGGVVEVSTNGGGSWSDLGNFFLQGGYNVTLNTSGNPLSARRAFSGNSGGFILSKINLSSFAGQTIMIRFRLGSDASVGGTGWYVDDIFLDNRPLVYMKSGLYNASNAVVAVEDTTVEILPPGACVDPSITAHPASVVRCSVSGNGVFSVTAAGTAPTYQWQVSTNNGSTWSPIGAATSATYTIVNPTSALNGNLYRCVVTGLCGVPAISRPAVMYVSPALTHSAVSATPSAVCVGGSTVITGTANNGTAGTNGMIGASGIINVAIPDNDPLGINSTITLPALSIPAASNLKLRLNMAHTWVGDIKVTLTSPCGITFAFDRPGVPPGAFGNSNDLSGNYIFDLAGATVLSEAGPVPAGTYQPSDVNGAPHTWAGVTFPCSAAGGWVLNVSDNAPGDVGTITDWAILMGGNYTHSLTGAGTIVQNPPSGANNATGNFTVTALPAGVQNYTLVSTDILGCTVSSNIVVTVTGAPTITTQPVNRTICQNGNTTFSIVDNTPLPPSYQWQISTNGGATWTNLANVAPFSNVTTATLTITGAGLVYNGNLFRCVVSNACGTVNSNSASLTVNPLPVVNSGPSGLCAPVTLTASGNANTYSWSPATGLNTTTGPVVIASPVVTTIYTVTGTITATGCQNSASVTVLGTPATPVITPAAPVICAGTIQPLTASATAMPVSGGAITIPALGNGNPYPSAISAAGLPTSGVRVKSVSLLGMSHTFPADVDVVLVSPTGTSVIIMSDAGGATDIVNANLVFDDAAATILPATIVSGTYRPTNTAGPDNFPAPGPGNITNVNPTLSSFTGNFNGNWNLYVVDDLGGDAGSITSWTITFEIPTAIWSPITGLFSDPNATIPYVAGTPATTVYFLQNPTVTTAYTYTVINTLGTCSSGPATVTVTVNPKPTISVSPNNQCGPVTLTATGTPAGVTFGWSPAYGLTTTPQQNVVIANPPLNTIYTVTDTILSTGCTNSATVTVNATPAAPVISPSSISLCLGGTATLNVVGSPVTTPLGGTITIPAGAPTTTSGVASPYPGIINVAGLPTSGVRVKSVNINGISHTFPGDLDMMLQSPTATNVILMSDVGGGVDIINANLVFDDAAATTLPGTIVTGTYRPTNTAGPDNFPAPGPGSITNVNPVLSAFTGNLNGAWNLYINDQVGGDVGTITSWSITFEITGAIWSPVTALFTDAGATVPYVAGTMAGRVYAKPTTTTTYTASRVNGTCTSSTNVTVTVYQPITITTQPASQSVCAGANVTFSIVTTGNFQTYQWQVSTNGGSTWTNITNAYASSLVLNNVATTLSGNQYRVIVTNSCNTVTSSAATLTVNALTPAVATDLWNMRICLSDSLVPLVGTPVGGSWSGVGVSGFNFIPGATAVGTYVLTYSYTNAAGCTTTDTTLVKVSDCPERIRLLINDAVILYPNPNNGRFFIRMNSTLYNYLGMRVYTVGGQLIKTQTFGGLVYGRTIPIDLSHLPSATYLVKFYYDDGIRSSEKGFLVVVGR